MKKMRFLIKIWLCAALVLGMFPAAGMAAINQNNSDISIVFAIDNGIDMYNYGYYDDNEWLDAYVGMMEQVAWAEFAVVTRNSASQLVEFDAAKELIYEIESLAERADAAELLEDATEVFDENSGRKIVVLSSALCYNNSELEMAVNTAERQGIEVWIAAFEDDAQKAAEIESAYENAIVCRDVYELPILLGDWYAELADIPELRSGVMNLMSVNSVSETIYQSGFRTNKHAYNSNVLSNKGSRKNAVALSELLNMYYLLPSWVENGYNLSTNEYMNIAKGNTIQLSYSDELGKLLDFWNNQAGSILGTNCAISSDDGITAEMHPAIEENLKRRMPVMLVAGSETYLIIAYKSDGTYDLFSTSGVVVSSSNVSLPDEIQIIDTGRYFNLLRSGKYISDRQVSTGNGKRVMISLPDGYNGETNHFVQCGGNTVVCEENIVNGEAVFEANRDAEFYVGVKVVFDGIEPNCYNATRGYKIKIYADVSDAHWFADYVFDMSSKGIVVGEDMYDNLNNYEKTLFFPNDYITIVHFLTIMYRAADIANVEAYSSEMAEHAFGEEWISQGQYNEVMYEFDEDNLTECRMITREEAADILWKVFKSLECRTPHQLFEYDANNVLWDRVKIWIKYNDKDTDGTRWTVRHMNYDEGLYQLFLNGIMTGYEDNTLQPEAPITRAETCKIISKTMYSTAEMGTTLEPVTNDSHVSELTLGISKIVRLSEYGGATCSAAVSQPGYYSIDTDENYALYNAAGTRLKPVDTVSGKDVYMITNAQNLKLYMSGESGANASVKVERMTGGYIAPNKLNYIKDAGTSSKPKYYLFDDNREFLTVNELADNGTNSTTIAHFGDLGVGKYTFFGYHNRNNTFTGEHLYYDPVFWNPEGKSGSVKITRVGADPLNWNWNQVWADFSGEMVYAEKFYERGDETENLPYYNRLENYISLPSSYTIGANTKTWFSQFLTSGQIEEMEGAIWIIFEFEVTEGTVNFDTVAYQNPSQKGNINISSIQKGNYDESEEDNPTIKGKSNYDTVVSTSFDYVIDNSVPSGTVLPVKVVNQFHPDGHQNLFNVFTTRTNSYSTEGKYTNWISADDSGMFPFIYTDNDNEHKTWVFAPTYNPDTGEILPTPSTGPVVGEKTSHLGNYGVTEKYNITLYNAGNEERVFSYRMEAQGFYIYKVNVKYNGVIQTGDKYNKQLFRYAYMDNKDSHGIILDDVIITYEYIDIPIPANKTTTIELEVTLTTGCNMTLHNSMVIDRDMNIERIGDVQ